MAGEEDLIRLGVELDATQSVASSQELNTKLDALVAKNQAAQREVDQLSDALKGQAAAMDKLAAKSKAAAPALGLGPGGGASPTPGAGDRMIGGLTASAMQYQQSGAAAWERSMGRLREQQVALNAQTQRATSLWTTFTSAGSGATGMLGGLAGALAKVLAPLLTFMGVREAIQFFRDMVREGSLAEQSQVRLAAVLKATGSAAGVTEQEITALASSMQQTRLVDDEQVKDAAALLMTFRTIQGQTLKDAIRLSSDLSAVLGTDMTSSAMLLGKALAEPAEGLGALSRAGIKLSESQKDLIQQMDRNGQKVQAQTMLLGLLEQRVGGVGAAANTGLTGAMHEAKVAWSEFLEGLAQTSLVKGTVIAALDTIAAKIRSLTPTANTEQERAKQELAQVQAQLQSPVRVDNAMALNRGGMAAIDTERVALKARERELLQTVAYYQALEGLAQRRATEAAKEAAAETERQRLEAERVTILQQVEDQVASLGKTEFEAERIAILHNKELTATAREAMLRAVAARQAFADASAEAQARMQIVTLGQTGASAEYAALALETLTTRQRAARESVIAATAAFEQQQTALEQVREAEEALLREQQALEQADQQHLQTVNSAMAGLFDQNQAMEEQLEITRRLGAAHADGAIAAATLRREFLGLNPSPEDLARFDQMLAQHQQLQTQLASQQQKVKAWEEAWRSAIENTQSAIADFLVDLGDMTASVEDFFLTLLRLIQRAAAEAAAAELTGLLGGALKAIVGGFGGGSGIPAAPDTSWLPGANAGIPSSLPAATALPSVRALPAASAQGAEAPVNVQVAATVNVLSLDPRTAADVLRGQAGTIGQIMVESVRNSRELQQALRGR